MCEATLDDVSYTPQNTTAYIPSESFWNHRSPPYEYSRTGTTQYEHVFEDSRHESLNVEILNNFTVCEATEENILPTQKNIDNYPLVSPIKTPEATSKTSVNDNAINHSLASEVVRRILCQQG